MTYRYGETVYVSPTVATVAWPTSYSATAYYAVPTSYGFDSYLPTSYAYDAVPMTSASYLTTGYTVRRGLFGRLRLVERPVVASYATSYLPTTYFAPSYAPTTYVASSYAPTTYVASSYVPTTYVASRYLPTVYTPRVYRPTVYLPTTYEYASTGWETSYPSSTSWDCGEQVAWNTPRMSAPAVSYPAAAPSVPSRSSEVTSRAAEPDSNLESILPSTVPPAPAEEAAPRATNIESPKSSAVERADSPPAVPPARQPANPSTAPATGGQGNSSPTTKSTAAPANTPKPAPPAAPGGDPTEPDLRPAPIDNSGTNRRDSLRPAYVARPARTEQVRNVLMGRVESEAGEPLSEVPISATNRDNITVRRAAMSDAFGNFSIRLGDGEWTVNVRTPSGRVYPVRTVTVSNGRVLDNQEGREVRNLIISY
jgi:hypothetical protein